VATFHVATFNGALSEAKGDRTEPERSEGRQDGARSEAEGDAMSPERSGGRYMCTS